MRKMGSRRQGANRRESQQERQQSHRVQFLTNPGVIKTVQFPYSLGHQLALISRIQIIRSAVITLQTLQDDKLSQRVKKSRVNGTQLGIEPRTF